MIVVLGSHKRKVREKLVINKGVDPSYHPGVQKGKCEVEEKCKSEEKTKQNKALRIYICYLSIEFD